ncbi:S41 family peptidase [Entomobacter blattae]|uniref:Tricorn protease homolog n=1 Tax=Entomobacter blattae TaxID=2762277 RepID=A0A7H1NPL1_9PROT|nr:S41 family peptidase [Entomobacter blattae]QNT77721.1 Tricorn protease [Entomobacter blattae]
MHKKMKKWLQGFITHTPFYAFSLFAGVASSALYFGCYPAKAAGSPLDYGGRQPVFMRFPTLKNNQIVFIAHGNLWSVDRKGGTARRLTTELGDEYMPRFSPNGQWIAFTASYQGNRDVYVIPASGGSPRRLTYHSDITPQAPERWGPDNLVIAWTPDSKKIIFLSRRQAWNSWITLPFQVSVEGGLPERFPLDRSGLMSFSPDGKKIAYNRIFRDFRTWKRYNGGLAQQLYTYDLVSQELTPIAKGWGSATNPMWYGQKIYFISDRGDQKRRNLWVYNLENHKAEQVTHFTDYDVDFASLGDNGLVFQQGGNLYVLDLPDHTLHKVEAQVPDDASRTGRRFITIDEYVRYKDTAEQPDYDLAPSGKRLAISARGEVLTVPVDYGAVRNLTKTSGIDEDHPAWSPDGRLLAYATDKDGEYQLAIRPALGGEEKILTHFKNGYLYQPVFSPGGKYLATADAGHNLWVTSIENGQTVLVATDKHSEIHDQSWSPDGRFLAYSLVEENQQRSVWIYNREKAEARKVSMGENSDFNPVFSADGHYLFFASQRHDNAVFSEHEFNVSTAQTIGIYVTPLTAQLQPLLGIRSDEGKWVKDKEKKNIPTEDAPKTTIEFEGLMQRATPVPLKLGSLQSYAIRGDKLFYLLGPAQSIEGPLEGEDKGRLFSFDLKERKDTLIQGGVESFVLNRDGSKLAYLSEKKLSVIDAKEKHEPPKPLDFSTVGLFVSPQDEWKEMFRSAWRLERDLFVNPHMNGVDWQEVYNRYASLLPYVGSRSDLNYLIGEMQGELGNSHTYVGGGDYGDIRPRAPTLLLGAEFTLDKASGRYRIEKIYPGDATRSDYRSPLAEPGSIAKEGEYLLAINGQELRSPLTPYQLLAGVKGPLMLTLSDELAGKPHDITVNPISSELNLREKAWIDHNRALVEKESHGQIGYIYLSDMEGRGMEQFIRQFYSQLDKAGLIIDDRWNGGGFIDQILLERLRRILVGMSTNRQLGQGTIPQQLINGPKAVLINQYSASDGDIFPYYFRAYGLGPVIGKRSWGGVRGIRGEWPLLDGGYITIPEESIYGLNSTWVIENQGVKPDIEVENTPQEVLNGKDQQLLTAIHYVMDQLGQKHSHFPPPPSWSNPYPPQE